MMGATPLVLTAMSLVAQSVSSDIDLSATSPVDAAGLSRVTRTLPEDELRAKIKEAAKYEAHYTPRRGDQARLPIGSVFVLADADRPVAPQMPGLLNALSTYYAPEDRYRPSRRGTPKERVGEAGGLVANACLEVTVQQLSQPSITPAGLPNLAGSWRVPEDDRVRVRAAWFKITDPRSPLRHREGACLALNLVKSPTWDQIPPEHYGRVWDEVIIEYAQMDKKDRRQAATLANRAGLAATLNSGLSATAAQAERDQASTRIRIARIHSALTP